MSVSRHPAQASRSAPVDECKVRCIRPEAVARAREVLEAPDTYSELAMLFAALSDPTRARIVHLVLQEEMCTCDLAVVLGVSESAVSQHLRVLRSLRLVRARRAGKIVFYTLDDKHVARLVQLGLTHLGHQAAADRLAAVSALA
jgi:DNA-binding transcriptional ArsR family regulator